MYLEKSFSVSLNYLFFIIIFLCTWRTALSQQTTINGVISLDISRTPSVLQNNKLILIIKNNQSLDDIYYMQQNINQGSFPYRFTITNIKDIKRTGVYLFTLLIFSSTHKLMWEGSPFQRNLTVNQTNDITFIVKDVYTATPQKCLSETYPCLETANQASQAVSICCSNMICQRSKTNQSTCVVKTTVTQNLTMTYSLPANVLPVIGSLSKYFIDSTEKQFQAKAETGITVKIQNASVFLKPTNRIENARWYSTIKYLLQIRLSIINSESCRDCITRTLQNIRSQPVAFDIIQQNKASTFITIQAPFVALSGIWTPTNNMKSSRILHTATLVRDGLVLVVGGMDLAYARLSTAELYDPVTGNWALASKLTYPRVLHSASLLPNGKVLVVGGVLDKGYLSTAELYDPLTDKWTVTGSMTYPRATHTASVLSNGIVLVVGGVCDDGYLATAELYDPATGKWKLTSSMTYRRAAHSASVLSNGKVLVVGGKYNNDTLFTTELYDPVTSKWTVTARINQARAAQSSVLLADGRALIIGGKYNDSTLFSAELYNSGSNTWKLTSNTTYGRAGHTTSILNDGRILVVGSDVSPSTAEIYDSQTGSWTPIADVTYPRVFHVQSVLPNGTVLIAGGIMGTNILIAEQYNV